MNECKVQGGVRCVCVCGRPHTWCRAAGDSQTSRRGMTVVSVDTAAWPVSRQAGGRARTVPGCEVSLGQVPAPVWTAFD